MANTYIKSPLNYIGGKYKLLKDIVPLFPENIKTFVDLFGGGFNVGINSEAEQILYNDSLLPVTQLLMTLKGTPLDQLLNDIDSCIDTYKLTKENKEGYLALRENWNKDKSNFIELYVLICYAFNNQIRFNKKGEYNMPFGKDRSSFNPTLRSRFIDFVNKLQTVSVVFGSLDFRILIESLFPKLKENDFVYCDPPYLGSIATYNESGGWGDSEEQSLLEGLDMLNEKGIKFALSNNLKYENALLEEWIKKYNVIYLNADYSNCNYQKKDKSKSIEILVKNY